MSLGQLIFEIFRLNGQLLAAGDELVEPVGLTSARWQVMWAIDIAGGTEPVAHLARRMGLNRQGVQRIVNELEAAGLVVLSDNPYHARARIVSFSEQGRAVYAAADQLRRPWLEQLGRDIDPDDLRRARQVLATLRKKLDTGPE